MFFIFATHESHFNHVVYRHMKKWLCAALLLLIPLCGCIDKKTADTDTTVEEYGIVISVDTDFVTVQIDGSDIKIQDNENIAVLKDNQIIKPSLLKSRDHILLTYKDGTLQVVQVIS